MRTWGRGTFSERKHNHITCLLFSGKELPPSTTLHPPSQGCAPEVCASPLSPYPALLPEDARIRGRRTPLEKRVVLGGGLHPTTENAKRVDVYVHIRSLHPHRARHILRSWAAPQPTPSLSQPAPSRLSLLRIHPLRIQIL